MFLKIAKRPKCFFFFSFFLWQTFSFETRKSGINFIEPTRFIATRLVWMVIFYFITVWLVSKPHRYMSCTHAYSFIIVLDEYIYIYIYISVKTNQQLTNNKKIHKWFEKSNSSPKNKSKLFPFSTQILPISVGCLCVGENFTFQFIFISFIYLFIFVSILPMYVGGFHIQTHMGQAFFQKI